LQSLVDRQPQLPDFHIATIFQGEGPSLFRGMPRTCHEAEAVELEGELPGTVFLTEAVGHFA